MRLSELADKIGGKLIPPSSGAIEIKGIAPIHTATGDHITFQTNPKYAALLADCQAAAVILGQATDRTQIPQLIHDNPYAAMAKTSQLFHQDTHTFQGQSELAIVHPEAEVDPSVTLYPYCVVDKGAKVGAGTILYPHVVIGRDSTVGTNCVFYAGTVIMHECLIGNNVILHAHCVIGADGFGFAPSAEGNVKIPQIGKVIIEDDVELQAACTIDRGALEDTIIGRGTKIDDQVLIAHGVQLGEHCLIAGQGAIAGSTKIGKRFIMAGCGAVGPSLQITDNVIAGPKIGITAPIKEPGEYIGYPARPAGDWRKQTVGIKRLPELMRTIKELQRRVAELENK